MISSLSSTFKFRNTVRVRSGDREVVGQNLVVYGGDDVVAALLAGLPAYKISHIAFEYENTAGTPAPAPAARTDSNATLMGLAGNFDYVRAALSAGPLLAASDGNHAGNQVTFTATTTAAIGEHSLAFSAAQNSKVYAVSLLAAPTGLAAGDVMFARWILSTPLPVVGSGQVSATWTVRAA
jgi:hypothetical protein